MATDGEDSDCSKVIPERNISINMIHDRTINNHRERVLRLHDASVTVENMLMLLVKGAKIAIDIIGCVI